VGRRWSHGHGRRSRRPAFSRRKKSGQSLEGYARSRRRVPQLRTEAMASSAAIGGDRAIDEAASGGCVLAGAVPRAGSRTRGDAGRRLARATPSRARGARRIKAYFGRTARRIAAGYTRVGGRAQCIGIAVRRRFARLRGVVEAVGGCRLVARRVLLGARRGGVVSRGRRVAALSAAAEKAERGERGHDGVESTEGGKGQAPSVVVIDSEFLRPTGTSTIRARTRPARTRAGGRGSGPRGAGRSSYCRLRRSSATRSPRRPGRRRSRPGD
jgi:hypothetical protein